MPITPLERPGKDMSSPNCKHLDMMTPSETADFFRELERALADDDDSAAKDHLQAGRFITYRDPFFSHGLVREWPNGNRELIEADLEGNIKVIKKI